jgi:hypothetical protein
MRLALAFSTNASRAALIDACTVPKAPKAIARSEERIVIEIRLSLKLRPRLQMKAKESVVKVQDKKTKAITTFYTLRRTTTPKMER